jgi:RNA polymerase sigma factor for flagellar operon FliA
MSLVGDDPGLSRDQLVERYSYLIKFVVGRLGVSVSGVFDHEDAMQAGAIGLLQAIDAYRPGMGASFASYAITRIRGAILDAVRSLDTVGRAGREAGRAIAEAIRELTASLGRPPVEAEVASHLGCSVERYRERLQGASVVTISLTELDRHDDDEAGAFDEVTPDPTAVDPAGEAVRLGVLESLTGAIGTLPQRQQLILSLYYREELTYREIAEVLGVTESRICQIHTEAVLSLRGRMLEPGEVARISSRRARR